MAHAFQKSYSTAKSFKNIYNKPAMVTLRIDLKTATKKKIWGRLQQG